MLESECKRHNIEMPCWYFYDSLLYLRTKIQCNSYRLADVYKHVVGEDFNETHMALNDAKGLWEILKRIPPDSLFMYPKYLTPLQNIKWVGSACETRGDLPFSRRRAHVILSETARGLGAVNS